MKGQFYGKKYGLNNYCITTFYIENLYGYRWKIINGLINNKGKYLLKMTPNTKDGSGATDYNCKGDGYIDIKTTVPAGNISYIKNMTLVPKRGLFPYIVSNASSSTDYCDCFWSDNTSIMRGQFGGCSTDDLQIGIFCLAINTDETFNAWWVTTCVCYK